jgi:mediator of RNA polymerase II transcription subunit 10
VRHLTNIDDLAKHCQTLIPMQVLSEIDNAQNPVMLTQDRLEQAATENQFMNAKIATLDVHFLLCCMSPTFVLSRTGSI